MARSPKQPGTSVPIVVEAQVYVTARGRSVVNGTVVVDGEMRTVKHDLDDAAKNRIIEVLMRELWGTS